MQGLDIPEREQFAAIKETAESGNAQAMFQLADFYEKGFGVSANPEMAEY